MEPLLIIEENEEETYNNMIKRIKLKRQTKLICTLDENWNNTDKIAKLLNYGVDCIEIYSEVDDTVKQEMISKIRSFAKKNKQIIPIMYTLSYYHVYISKILNNEKEINFTQNSVLYITNDIDEITEKIHNMNVQISEDIPTVDYTIISIEPQLIFNNFSDTDIIHINFGDISFKISEISESYLKCIALNPGKIIKGNMISL